MKKALMLFILALGSLFFMTKGANAQEWSTSAQWNNNGWNGWENTSSNTWNNGWNNGWQNQGTSTTTINTTPAANWNTWNSNGQMNTSNTWNGGMGWNHVVHTYPPQPMAQLNVQTGQTAAVANRIQNVGPGFTTPVLCFDQYNGGMKKNLGCQPNVTFTDSNNGPSFVDLNYWPDLSARGRNVIKASYVDQWGNWREVTNPWGNKQETVVNVM